MNSGGASEQVPFPPRLHVQHLHAGPYSAVHEHGRFEPQALADVDRPGHRLAEYGREEAAHEDAVHDGALEGRARGVGGVRVQRVGVAAQMREALHLGGAEAVQHP